MYLNPIFNEEIEKKLTFALDKLEESDRSAVKRQMGFFISKYNDKILEYLENAEINGKHTAILFLAAFETLQDKLEGKSTPKKNISELRYDREEESRGSECWFIRY